MKRPIPQTGIVCLWFAQAFAFQTAPLYEHLANVMVPMRDGVRLSTHVYYPLKQHGPFPALLLRTPYGKGKDLLPGYRTFIDHGYAVVVQDVRGRWGSEGVFHPPEQEGQDGWDTLDWIAKQVWSNGRIGMLGGSYLGIAQWQVALLNNPHLKAIFPVVSGSDEYRDRFYSTGGAFKLGHRLLWMAENVKIAGFEPPPFEKFIWHLPLRTSDVDATGHRVDFLQQALDHPLYDSFWKRRSVREHLSSIRIPVFSVAGWYDNYGQSDLETFGERKRNGRVHRIVVGPWGHDMSIPFKEMSYSPESRANVRRFQLDWFDRWVKDSPAPDPAPAARIFVMGINQWRDEQDWPLERTRYTRFFLSSKGKANSVYGDGELRDSARKKSPSDEFVYDPRKPVPTHGGAVCCNPRIFPWGAMDQRTIEQRRDVLVYSTAPLKRDLEVTGPVKVFLSVATDARDTDFTAKLVDVYPDGRAINLCDGILRLRYRESLEKSVLARPGEVYAIQVDAGVTSNVFRAGHRIRLEVSSSNFPRFDRNLNSGRTPADDTEIRSARQTVFHDVKYPSYVLLPLIPAENPVSAQRAR